LCSMHTSWQRPSRNENNGETMARDFVLVEHKRRV
jgi:hypothetical protein